MSSDGKTPAAATQAAAANPADGPAAGPAASPAAGPAAANTEIHFCILYGTQGACQYITIEQLPDGRQLVKLVCHPGMLIELDGRQLVDNFQKYGMMLYLKMHPLQITCDGTYKLSCPPELVCRALCDLIADNLVVPPEIKELVEEVLGRCVLSLDENKIVPAEYEVMVAQFLRTFRATIEPSHSGALIKFFENWQNDICNSPRNLWGQIYKRKRYHFLQSNTLDCKK